MEGRVEGEAQGVDDQKKINQFVTVVIFVTMYNSFLLKSNAFPIVICSCNDPSIADYIVTSAV
jgi:hypothetical protein